MPVYMFFAPPQEGDNVPRITVKPESLDTAIPIAIDYLAEGSANIVYSISRTARVGAEAAAAHSQSSYPLPRKLLRLSKKAWSREGFDASQAFYRDTIKPMFAEEELVPTEAVELPAQLIASLNSHLKRAEAEGTRASSRHGQYLAENQSTAILLADMTCRLDDGFTLEFKPKWLTDSPNAPQLGLRCRTCALRVMSARRPGGKPSRIVYCPLALVTGKPDDIDACAALILQQSPHADALTEAQKLLVRGTLARYLSGPGLRLMKVLAKQVRLLDPHGVLNQIIRAKPVPDFFTAMTLRDCTLFVRCKWNEPDSIEARLADWDLKTPADEKMAYWAKTEVLLDRDGYYLCKEEPPAPEVTCLRSRTFPDVPWFM